MILHGCSQVRILRGKRAASVVEVLALERGREHPMTALQRDTKKQAQGQIYKLDKYEGLYCQFIQGLIYKFNKFEGPEGNAIYSFCPFAFSIVERCGKNSRSLRRRATSRPRPRRFPLLLVPALVKRVRIRWAGDC